MLPLLTPYTLHSTGFDPAKMPLGKLKKSTVMQGYQCLQVCAA